MMRRLLLVLALIWPSVGAAQYWATRAVCTVEQVKIHPQVFDPPGLGVLEAEAATYVNGTGRFWRITAPGGGASHLWGTMHANDPAILDLPEDVIRAIDRARIVAVETNFIFPSRRILERDRDRRDWWRPFRSAFKFESSGIDPQIIDWIRSRTHGIGMSRKTPDQLTYGGLTAMIVGDPCNDFAEGILPVQDDRIQMLGMIAGAGILGLEPVGAVTAFLDAPENEPTALAILAVYGAYLNPDATSEARATSFALYHQGRTGLARAWDRAYLRRIFGREPGDKLLAHSDEYLLNRRNRSFLDVALADLTQGGVFAAIGNFHISGDQGMVALLRRAGFTVVRIPLPGEVP